MSDLKNETVAATARHSYFVVVVRPTSQPNATMIGHAQVDNKQFNGIQLEFENRLKCSQNLKQQNIENLHQLSSANSK